MLYETRMGVEKKKGRQEASFSTESDLGGSAPREFGAAKHRTQHVSYIIGRADVGRASLECSHPHLFVRNTVRTNNRQFRKLAVQTLDVSEPPVFNIENHSFRMISLNLSP